MQPDEPFELADIFAVEAAPQNTAPITLPRNELRAQPRGHSTSHAAYNARASRPLTRAERDAARRDRGIRPPTFAPASQRVAKQPAPGDERFFRNRPKR